MSKQAGELQTTHLPLTREGKAGGTQGLNKLGWWILFALATVSLSLFFRTFKAFTLSPDGAHAGPFALASGLLIASFVTLVYDSYVKEKEKGKIHRPVKFFEWIYAYTAPFARSPGTLSLKGREVDDVVKNGGSK